MDQVKIGKFIKTMRKEKALTQREISEKLNISEKTVSKWETGNGLPEISLMMPLCEILEISVNELLSGERLDENSYLKKAEENIMSLIKEKEESKKKIILSALIIFITIISGVTIILLVGTMEMEIWKRIILIIISIAIISLGIAVACILEKDAGYFECKYCGERFIPSMKDYIFGPHTITTRYLKCPKCNQKSYCKKRLSK